MVVPDVGGCSSLGRVELVKWGYVPGSQTAVHILLLHRNAFFQMTCLGDRDLIRVAPAAGTLKESWVSDTFGNYVNAVTTVNRGTGVVTSNVNAVPAPNKWPLFALRKLDSFILNGFQVIFSCVLLFLNVRHSEQPADHLEFFCGQNRLLLFDVIGV